MEAETTKSSPERKMSSTQGEEPGQTDDEAGEEYDPYQHRTQGTIGTLIGFLHLLKSSIGSGVLSMPAGFKSAGMSAGFIMAVILPMMVIYCFLIMINTMVKIAAAKKVPYASLQESAKWSMEHSHKCFERYGKTMVILIDVMAIINYVGTCAAYYNYVIVCTLTVMGGEFAHLAEGAINLPRTLIGLAWVIPFFAVNCFRDMKALAPTSMVGNFLICTALMIVIGFIFRPNDKGKIEFSDSWQYVTTVGETPLFIGTMVFSVGSVGVCLAVEKDMKDSRRFVGWTGIYNLAMWLSVAFYIIIAFLGYYKYGYCTRATIVLNMDAGTWYAITVQVAVGVALFFSFPLMCFIIFDLLWFELIDKRVQKRRLMWEYLFRFGTTLFIGFIALLVPRLDLVLGFVGSFALGFLSFFLPGLLEYNYTYGKLGWTKAARTLAKDIFIMVFSAVAIGAGTYSSLYGIFAALIPSNKNPLVNCTKIRSSGANPKA